MGFNWDPVYVANLALCIVIFMLGCWGYRKRRDALRILSCTEDKLENPLEKTCGWIKENQERTKRAQGSACKV